MTRYLIRGNYTPEGAKGILAQGGTSRWKQIDEMVADLGGKLESLYWAFGDTDLSIIAETPDAPTAAAVGLTVASAGAVHTSTTVLLTAEEMDQAGTKKVGHKVPSATERARSVRAQGG
jgi:uncharacterized protein with GYD domain